MSYTTQDGMLAAGTLTIESTYQGYHVHVAFSIQSCFGDATKSRNKLILPAICTSRLYIIDTGTDQRAPKMFKVVVLQLVTVYFNTAVW